MILPGLTSVTFRGHSPQDVVHLVSAAGLKGIEWGADIHVPPGRMRLAELVAQMTHEAGLKVSAYGSYFNTGPETAERRDFAEVLKTAEVLGAPLIRIWAGNRSSQDAGAKYWQSVIDLTRAVADEAGKEGVRLAFEFHEGTLNDTYESCCELLGKINHPMVQTYWQPVHGAGPGVNGAGIEKILPWLTGVHVFHWWPDARTRKPLKDGLNDWRIYFSKLSQAKGKIYANLEFVVDDAEDRFVEDAGVLLDLIGMGQRTIGGNTPIANTNPELQT